MIANYEVLDALPQGIFCINRDYKIIYWNQILEIWTGKISEDTGGLDAREIFPELNKKFYQLMIHQVFEVGSTAVFSYQLHKSLFKFPQKNRDSLCIQSQVVRSPDPKLDGEYIAVFSLQDISGLVKQIALNKEVKDQLLIVLDEMKVKENELQRINTELHKVATTDPLTGLNNRRSMLKSMNDEIERYKRYDTDFSILLTDIDNFKLFNDTHGHACGDYILKALAELFHETMRPIDSVSRWGGEEFLFLLPGTDAQAAVATAERIRKAVQDNLFRFSDKQHKVTMTFGVEHYDACKDDNHMISNADKALYHGKKAGKNRVILYSELIK